MFPGITSARRSGCDSTTCVRIALVSESLRRVAARPVDIGPDWFGCAEDEAIEGSVRRCHQSQARCKRCFQARFAAIKLDPDDQLNDVALVSNGCW